jgi:uncharacterized phage-associated protein
MPLQFRDEKATQTAARFLQRAGGRMNLMKLVKLIYLADRAALVKWGRPITMDLFCSLPHGPIVSNTLNLINEQPDPSFRRYWHQYISERQTNYDVVLDHDPHGDQLSRAEETVIDEVFAKYGHLDQWRLRDFTHTLPEWRDPGASMLPIRIRDILLPEGYSEKEIGEIEAVLEYASDIHQSLT